MAEKQKYTVHQTQFELSPASNEQGFCFTHYNAPSDRACIGHLRGDFGETGTTFHHTWWPHNAHLITPSFNTELKDVITGLRQNGLLKDRKTMLARSMRFRTAIIPTEGRNTTPMQRASPRTCRTAFPTIRHTPCWPTANLCVCCARPRTSTVWWNCMGCPTRRRTI